MVRLSLRLMRGNKTSASNNFCRRRVAWTACGAPFSLYTHHREMGCRHARSILKFFYGMRASTANGALSRRGGLSYCMGLTASGKVLSMRKWSAAAPGLSLPCYDPVAASRAEYPGHQSLQEKRNLMRDHKRGFMNVINPRRTYCLSDSLGYGRQKVFFNSKAVFIT